MANTTKKVNTTAPIVNKDADLKKENDTLKNELDAMKKQMEQMMQQMATFNMFASMSQNQTNYIDKDVSVTSLVSGQLILSTTGRSDGKIYKFNNQFEEIAIPVADLKAICASMKSTAMNGKFFINDAEFVREAGLSSSYRSILDRVQLTNILSMPVEEFIAKFKAVPKAQKNIITTMVQDKRMNGEFVDGNILLALKDLTGIDFTSIEQIPEEYRMFKEA